MTAPADCDPLWTDEEWERLCQRAADYEHDYTHPRDRDLLGQLTRQEIRTMTTIQPCPEYL